MAIVHRIRWWFLRSASYLWTRMWLCSPSLEANSCCDHCRGCSVVSLSGSCEFLASSLFEIGSSFVNQASPFSSVHSISLQVSRFDMAPLKIGFDRVFIPQFWSTLVSFAGLKPPIHQSSQHPIFFHLNHVSNPSKLGLDDGGLYVGGLSLIEDLQISYVVRGVVQCAAPVQSWPDCGQSSTQRPSRHESHGRLWRLIGGRWWNLSSASVSTSGASRWSYTCPPSWISCWWYRGCALHTCWRGAGRFHWSCLLCVYPEPLPSCCSPFRPSPAIRVSLSAAISTW